MTGLFIVYLICFGVGLVFTLATAFMGHAFGGHDFHGDAGGADGQADGHAHVGGTGDMPGFSPLSPTTLASFITAFGGLGMVFSQIEATNRAVISLPLSALGAFAVAAAVFWLFQRIFHTTQSSSEARVASLIGLTANITAPISEHGVGEITYVTGGTRYTAPARSETGRPFGNGETVKITRIVGTHYYVTAN